MKLAYLWAKCIKKMRLSAIAKSRIHATSKVESGSHIVNTTFGKHSFCGYDCEIYNCRIGSYCSIANRVVIGGGQHPMNWVSTSPVFYEGRDSVKEKFAEHQRGDVQTTVIENDVWIGQNVLVRQGVTIGHGAVIGMGSVVTKDVQAYEIVAGCPARLIRMRFPDEIIEQLLEIKWWDFSDEKLRMYAPFFTDPSVFIKKIKRS